MSTDTDKFIKDLEAGVFDEKMSRILSEVAAAVVDHGEKGKKGKVTLTFELSRLGKGYQVMVKHQIAAVVPHDRGKYTDEDTGETPLYVGPKGALSFFPPDQTQLFDKKGEVANQGEK